MDFVLFMFFQEHSQIFASFGAILAEFRTHFVSNTFSRNFKMLPDPENRDEICEKIRLKPG